MGKGIITDFRMLVIAVITSLAVPVGTQAASGRWAEALALGVMGLVFAIVLLAKLGELRRLLAEPVRSRKQ